MWHSARWPRGRGRRDRGAGPGRGGWGCLAGRNDRLELGPRRSHPGPMTTLDADQQELAAKSLWEAERTYDPIGPPPVDFPGIDVDDAYEIQLINIRRRQAAGRLIRGHKVGLSSKAMQEMLGVGEPDYGHLMDDMFVFEDDEIDTARLCQPRVEGGGGL